MGIERPVPDWDLIVETLKVISKKTTVPTVFDFSYRKSTPFQILISTIISLRTKDSVTYASSKRLFGKAPDPVSILKLETGTIAGLIYPAGFYRHKSDNIKKIAKILLDKYNGEVPKKIEDLLELPGVGRKTANLTLGLSFGIPALCVDTHVHRIPNRM
ncbi:MAG: hypothetical protein L3J12_02615 [Spirochaetales bacterium]|nr:hypothetical protein [Spirochaetales bacterium]